MTLLTVDTKSAVSFYSLISASDISDVWQFGRISLFFYSLLSWMMTKLFILLGSCLDSSFSMALVSPLF